MDRKKVCIVGMGPAGLMAGTILLEQGFEVHFFDHKKAAGRKFLVAGNGGFNLTHSEISETFVEKYNRPYLQAAFQQFDNQEWINWLSKIGIETFVGSSGKIFPVKGIKPIEVLSAWIKRIEVLGGIFHFSHKLADFNEKEVVFTQKSSNISHFYDFLVLAMGGASWKKTGSTGEWKNILEAKGVDCKPFEASNSGFELKDWSEIAHLQGQSIKNIEVTFNTTSKIGDIVISTYGMEGTPIYFVNKEYRKDPQGCFSIDFKPTKTLEEIKEVLANAKNITSGLKKLNVSPVSIQLIKLRTSKEEYSSPIILAEIIKGMKFYPSSLRPIDEVISTVGGVSMEAITRDFQLKCYDKVFVCGEMLDWDAPTGGYLIQGCVSSGYKVAMSISRLIKG